MGKISKQTRKMMKSRREFKLEVLDRDDYKCRMCGQPGTYNTLDADHVAGRSSKIDDVRAAGSTICRWPWGECHNDKTAGRKKWKASQLHEETIEFIEERKWKMWEGIIWDRQ